jgi:hypothetical protein
VPAVRSGLPTHRSRLSAPSTTPCSRHQTSETSSTRESSWWTPGIHQASITESGQRPTAQPTRTTAAIIVPTRFDPGTRMLAGAVAVALCAASATPLLRFSASRRRIATSSAVTRQRPTAAVTHGLRSEDCPSRLLPSHQSRTPR